jgi:uncharacterized membrane protein
MIYWQEYKQYKRLAEGYLKDQISLNTDVQIEIYKFMLNQVSREQAIENIINVLSGGEHFKPLTK